MSRPRVCSILLLPEGAGGAVWRVGSLVEVASRRPHTRLFKSPVPRFRVSARVRPSLHRLCSGPRRSAGLAGRRALPSLARAEAAAGRAVLDGFWPPSVEPPYPVVPRPGDLPGSSLWSGPNPRDRRPPLKKTCLQPLRGWRGADLEQIGNIVKRDRKKYTSHARSRCAGDGERGPVGRVEIRTEDVGMV